MTTWHSPLAGGRAPRSARRTPSAARRRPPAASAAAAPGLAAALRLPARGPVRAAALRVLAAVGLVHDVPLVLPAVPVSGTPNTVRVGGYRYIAVAGDDGAPALRACAISVSRSAAGLPLNLAHEIGHLIDHVAIGDGDRFASAAGEPLLDGVMGAIRDTTALAALRSVRSRSRRRYLTDPRELFARAYAQWLALRSGDEALRAAVAVARRPRGGEAPAEQWDDDDFAPVALALDALVERLGWAATTTAPAAQPVRGAGGGQRSSSRPRGSSAPRSRRRPGSAAS